MTDPQREGRQIHRYRSRIALLLQLLGDIKADLHARAEDGAVPIGNSLWMRLCAALERKPANVLFRPLLVSGTIGVSDKGSTYLLIDTDQPEAEQVVALWHETLHLLGLVDEDLVENLALKLAAACPEILYSVRAAAGETDR